MKETFEPADMARYRATARAREAARQELEAQRREAAWQLARRAAELLRSQFGATRVIVFGSLAHAAWFHTRSDIDLAVAGLRDEDFWRADIALERLDRAFEFDLVTIGSAPPGLLAEIEQGVEL